MTNTLDDLSPFQFQEAATLENPTDASLLFGASTAISVAPGFWRFDAIYAYIKTKLGLADVDGLEDALAAKQSVDRRGEADGYASLDANALVPVNQIPVDALTFNFVKLETYDNVTPTDGQLWFDGTDIKFRVAGVTKTVTIA